MLDSPTLHADGLEIYSTCTIDSPATPALRELPPLSDAGRNCRESLAAKVQYGDFPSSVHIPNQKRCRISGTLSRTPHPAPRNLAKDSIEASTGQG